MISLYLHLPFCASKCAYCGFSSFAGIEKEIQEQYLERLEEEIRYYGKFLEGTTLKSIYFGGGTPNLIGNERLIRLFDLIAEHFDVETLGELSFEFNPYPQEQIFELLGTLNAKFKKLPRVRYSFGIQSFDNIVLKEAGRASTLPGLVEFLRGLPRYKGDNVLFNFDFIAFGKFNETKKGNRQLWNPSALEFFQEFASSGFADSFSLYTLELFDNQRWKKKDEGKLISGSYFGTDEDIYEEFSLLKEILLDEGFSRYELSNFSLLGRSSIHNRVYWDMEDYLGLGLNSSSFINGNSPLFGLFGKEMGKEKADGNFGVRWTNTNNLASYLEGERVDQEKIERMGEKDYLIESFFLGLRTDHGIKQISDFEKILVPNYEKKLESYEQQGFVKKGEFGNIFLTDEGMDVFNSIVTDIMAEI